MEIYGDGNSNIDFFPILTKILKKYSEEIQRNLGTKT